MGDLPSLLNNFTLLASYLMSLSFLNQYSLHILLVLIIFEINNQIINVLNKQEQMYRAAWFFTQRFNPFFQHSDRHYMAIF